MIIITHISYHIISPTQNYLSNKVPMMIPGDCNPCHRSHKNGGFTQFKIILIFIVKINQIWRKKHYSKVYRSSMGRAGGRVASACFIFITWVLLMKFLWWTKISVKKDVVKTDYGADDKALKYFLNIRQL